MFENQKKRKRKKNYIFILKFLLPNLKKKKKSKNRLPNNMTLKIILEFNIMKIKIEK